MDIGKLFSNASSAVTRAVQYTEEKLFHVEKTAYDGRTQYLMEQMDLCQSLTEKIVKAMENFIQPNPAYRLESMVYEKIDGKRIQHVSPANMLADTMLAASQSLYHGNNAVDAATDAPSSAPVNSYSSALRLAGDTHAAIGASQQLFMQTANTKFIEPLYNYLEQVKNVQKERRELELKRLDLDSVKTKVKRVVSEEAKKAVERELKTMQIEFDQQLEVTNLLMENVIASLDYHTRLLCDLVDCEVDYYEQCTDEMVKLRDSFKQF